MTAKEHAQRAVVLSNLADHCKPDPASKYRDAENLIVFHLRSAAAKARQIAEAKAQDENQTQEKEFADSHRQLLS